MDLILFSLEIQFLVLKKGFIDEFCLEIIKNGYDFIWGIETRSDLLDEQKLRLMVLAGLRSINIGIETLILI